MPATKQTPQKRVLLVRNAASYDFGGGERFVVYLAEELIRQGWDATVATAHAKISHLAEERQVPVVRGWWWSHQDWSGARVLLIPVYLIWQLVLLLHYLSLIARLKPQAVRLQSKDDFIAGTLAARLLGKRVVWTDHADLKYIYQNVPVWYKNPVGKLVYACSKLAHAVTLVSKSEERLVGAALNRTLPATYQVIYNGVFDSTHPPFSRPEHDSQALIFCCTSRLVTAKGIGELISAFQDINTDHSLRLWILGEGPEQQRFVEQAGKDPDITFWGFPANSLSMLQAADVFVHPSYHEGFSLSIIEAAALRMPIIACDVGGNPEIVIDDQTGLLVPERDSKALAAAMQRLAADASLRDRLASQARQSFEDNFQFDVIIKTRFVPLYEK